MKVLIKCRTPITKALNTLLTKKDDMTPTKLQAGVKRMTGKDVSKSVCSGFKGYFKAAQNNITTASKKPGSRSEQRKERTGVTDVTPAGIRQTRKLVDSLGGTESLRTHLEILEAAQG